MGPMRLELPLNCDKPMGCWFGLYSWNGKTFDYETLNPGEEIAFFFRVKLADDFEAYDGVNWHDVDDNVIQGDSVTFTITFRLEQITP